MPRFDSAICESCKKNFEIETRLIRHAIKTGIRRGIFCSKNCHAKHQITRIDVECKNCSSIFQKTRFQIKKTKNNFCTQSCAATYNNQHKKHGTRRSKLEVYVDERLREIFPSLQYECNKIFHGYEFDFMFPSLNLAIEINGIFHRKPIFGEKKLKNVKKRDLEKKKLCKEFGIELHVIRDVNKRFIEKLNKKLLDKVVKIVQRSSIHG